MDILGYLKNTHKNPKFGRVRQVPIRELRWEFPGRDLSHFAKFGIFCGYSLNTLKYISKNGNPLFFPVKWFKQVRGPAAKQANMQTSSLFVRPVLCVMFKSKYSGEFNYCYISIFAFVWIYNFVNKRRIPQRTNLTKGTAEHKVNQFNLHRQLTRNVSRNVSNKLVLYHYALYTTDE